MSSFPFKKILIVDDSPSMRKVFRGHVLVLGAEGDIIEANNGQEAIETLMAHASSKPFDLLVVDWNMPVVDGSALINFARKGLPEPQPTIVMVTSESEKDRVLVGLSLGVNAYVLKPFSFHSIKACFDNLQPHKPLARGA